MSRVGRKPIPIPSGVDVKIEGRSVEVKGPKGSLSCRIPDGIEARIEDSTILVEPTSEHRRYKAFYGLARALINNMVVGVSEGFSKTLEIIGVGYKVRKGSKDNEVILELGFSRPIDYKAPEGIKFDVDERNLIITVNGIDKQVVGQVAAEIRAYRPPEPYKGKGVRYRGEEVRRKAGKAKA